MKTEAEINAEKNAKPRVDIVPPALMLAAGRALGYGADKHGVPEGYDGFGTWRIPGTQQAEVLTHYACLMRHLLLWRAGEIIDPIERGGSGLPHLDHAAAQLAILLDLLERPPQGSGEAPDEAPPAEEVDPWTLPDGWEWRRGGGTFDTAIADLWHADQRFGGRVYADGSRFTGDEPQAIVNIVRRRNGVTP